MSESALAAPESNQRVNPWVFVPLVYFMQAIPVTIVQEVSPIVYKTLGVENAEITKWTSLIALPWAIQMFLGPLVELNSTRRRWILGMQLLICFGLAGFAMLSGVKDAFALGLGVLLMTGICSALCNVATDGFYILSLQEDQRAAFVGVQSTCYRLGRLFCAGLLVYLGGKMQEAGMSVAVSWIVVIGGCAGLYTLMRLVMQGALPKVAADKPPQVTFAAETQRNIFRTLSIVSLAISLYFALSSIVRLTAHLLYLAFDNGSALVNLDGWKLRDTEEILHVISGPGVTIEMSQLGVCAVLVLICAGAANQTIKGTEMGAAFSSFVKQSGFWAIFGFILFYRFGEAMVGKITPLFYLDPTSKGGIGLTQAQLGLVNNIVGVIGIVLGGLAGGWFVSQQGLRKSFWPLVLAMHVPNLLYVWAAYAQPGLAAVYPIVFIDQFGYGFGFAGYMVYLMWVAQRGQHQTSHYAIGTGMGALTIAVAGVLSGIVQSNFGYQAFFIFVMFCMIPGTIILRFIPLDETEGRGIKPVEVD